MSKRSRLVVILIVLAVCFAFLWPSLNWYFFTPKEDQALALGSREKIKDYARNVAKSDVRRFINSARLNDNTLISEEYAFLKDAASQNYRATRREVPAEWNARSLVEAFPTEGDMLSVIENHYRDRILELKLLQSRAVKLGLDLSGGMSLIIRADLDAALQAAGANVLDPVEFRLEAMAQAMEILNNRIDRFGLSEPVIRQQGEDRIYIEIPGSADADRINSIIMGRGLLAFHMVDDAATAAFMNYYQANPTQTFDAEYNLIDPSIIPSDTQVMGLFTEDAYGLDERIGFLVIKKAVGLEGRHIHDVQISSDELGQPQVTFNLDGDGTRIFADLTAANIGKPLAIVFDNKIKSYPTIQAAIPTGQVSITGFSLDEAENIRAVLRTAWLNVPLQLENQQIIGASMGAEAIRQGLFALVSGLAAVLLFMLLYYRGAGINAFVAQVLNLFILFSVLSALNLTLTLPSVAGMILTIGMAVDANVVIFERIKEELRRKKGRAASIAAGFQHAFWAIMDSNITTFIAAVFLSQLGTGPIRGFAYSLAIGVCSSVFTALFVSRLIFDFNTDAIKKEHVSISWRIK